MGKIIRLLAASKLSQKTIFNSRFVVECCENFHLHWRNLRLELTPPNFSAVAQTVETGNRVWQAQGSPPSHPHLELSRTVIQEPICQPTDLKIELCENLYKNHETSKDSHFLDEDLFVHLHYRDLRVEMSNEEFHRFARTVTEAHREFLTSFCLPLSDLFRTLDDHNILYVVLRNWDQLPDRVDVGPHSDLDLLVHPEHVEAFDKLWNVERTTNEPGRVQRKVPVLTPEGAQNFILVDVRTPGDGYLPEWFAHTALARRVRHKMFFILPPREHFLSLLYHAVYHKGFIAPDYAARLASLAAESTIEFDVRRAAELRYAVKILHRYGMEPTTPADPSVRPEMPFLHAPETVISSRLLTTVDAKPYHSRVYVLENNGKKTVVKQTLHELAEREYRFLSKLNSGHFPKPIRFWSEGASTVCEMEYIEGVPLSEWKKGRTAVELRTLIVECLQILRELQEKKIQHRDIREANILVREGKPVLLDFGWAITPDDPFITPPGLGDEGVPPDGVSCDVYAMGMIVRDLSFRHPELVHLADAMTAPVRAERVTEPERLQDLLVYGKPTDTRYAEALLELADYYLTNGDVQAASDTLARWSSDRPRHPGILVKRGEVFLMQGRIEEAERQFNDALSADPGNAKARFFLASLAKHAGKVEQAQDEFTKLLETQASDADARLLALVHNEAAELAVRRGDVEKAIEHLEKAAQLDPQNLTPIKNLADLKMASGAFRGALQLYQRVLELDPHDVEALTALANLCFNLERFDDAEFFCQEIVKHDPENERAQALLAEIRMTRFLSDEAAQNSVDGTGAKELSDEKNAVQSPDAVRQAVVAVSERYERVACPGCGHNDGKLFRNSADIVQCQKCELVYLRTRLTKTEMEKLYQSYADEGSHLHLPRSDEELRSTPLRRKYFLDEILQYTKPEGILLDIGCGWGAFLLEARDRGFEPRGIEITRKAAEYARDALQLPVNTSQFLETPFQPDSLSVVTMLHVLEHLPQTREAVERVFTILKPGGLFCGIVPNIASLCSLKQGDGWKWLDPNYHYVHFSPRTLKDLLQRAGFQIERIYTTSGDFTRETIHTIARRTAGLSNEQEVGRYVAEIEARGYGEEIRFVARKPAVETMAAEREVHQEQPREQIGVWKVERSDGLLASIIIPVYNRVEFTQRCLAAISRTVPESLPYEVIVVDNASSDGTKEFIEEERKGNSRLRYIRNSRNLLFARACNIGAEAANGKFLVFLNNDTEPQPGWLEAGIGRLQQYTDIGVVGGKLLYPDGSIQHCGIEFFANAHPKYPLWPLHRFLRAAADDPRVNLPEAVPAVTGACLFIPRRLFRSVGGFTEDYGMYFEDTDLCMKVKKRGKRVFYEPSCVVLHHEGASSPDRATIDALNEKAARVFFRRWQSEIQSMQFEMYVTARDGKFEFLSPEILPEGTGDTLTQDMLNEGAVRLATFFKGIGPFYAHFGGAGDAALLLSTFYDRDPEQTIVSVANSPTALQSFFAAFPKLKRIIFIPFPRFDHSHLLLRRLFAQLGNCQGMGATPTKNYDEEWNSTLDIFEKYRIKKHPRWAKAFKGPKLQPIQVTLQPKGSLRGMIGSKKNVIDRAAWSQLLATLNQLGITPIILGTPDEAREYPAEGTCIEKRSYSFEEQMRLIASSDIFIGADSWGKTFAALCGIPTIVFHALRGTDLATWKDPADYVFLDPWEEITVVRSVAEAETKVRELLAGGAARGPIHTTQRTASRRPEPETFCLVRYEGMGDVVMTFPVARLLKERHPGCRVLLATHPRYELLARACPWIDGTIPELPRGGSSRVYDLNAARFGLADSHQIDAYLEAFNLTASNAKKEILLNVPIESDAKVCELMRRYVEPVVERKAEHSRIVLLHAARGDINRTWPAERWAALGRLILEEGHVVILVGNNSSDPNRGTAQLECPGAIDLVGQLTPLDFVALCRRSHLLISTDSGPIQLAGASEIAIAGIYTVVPGRNRLPYRHGQPMWNAIAIEPDCPYAGCYRTMKDESYFASWRERLTSGVVQPAQMFAEWCVAESKYQCLEKLSPTAVWEQCKKLLDSVDQHTVESFVETTFV
jgi:GT2 family glycosyltransferase/ADP-heptose:LPS heptosyltransferase/tetratricopeptide (TPR) repeat protein